MFNHFTFSKHSFLIRARDAIMLPLYKGSTLRGGFGNTFKKVVCAIRTKNCDDCILKVKCIYFYIFETSPDEESDVLKNYNRIPHPFVIEPPMDENRIFQPGDMLTFNLILIGKATEYIPYFIYAFDALGTNGIGKGRGKYELIEVRCLKPEKDYIVYSSKDKILKNSETIRMSDILKIIPKTNTITLNLITPLRIILNGNLVVNLKFHHLIRSLLRRASTLSYFHCGEKLNIDFKEMINRAENTEKVVDELKWFDWERYSGRQNTRMKLGGLIGRVLFKGDFEEFLPLLKLGELLHAGKGTAFGLGRYEIISCRP